MEDLKAKLKIAKIELSEFEGSLEYANDRINETREEIAALEKQIAEAEVTYSIGDKFDHDSSGRMLIYINGIVYMLDTESGTRANSIPEVVDPCNITVEEFSALGTNGGYARTWDARKQEKC